ncbi:hypothetical protein CPB85DRAFT_1439692 [Mucidula mucida]|nr:hypothetical protein CPB85DRAFT_1439692 [Mucidula mucida]
MVQISLAALLLIPLASAAPLRMQKRIAQVISESTAKWEAACIAAGGNCDQQNAADSMIDLAKSLGGDAEMIRLAQLFVQQPRNAPDSLQVPYCQTAPKNAELNGLFHCHGDQTGNVPLGLTEVNPAGSCPAKTDGPVPDGVQLNTLVDDPGAGAASSGTASNGNGTDNTPVDNTGSGAAAGNGSVGDNTSSTVTDSTSPATSTSTSTSSSGFAQQNGLDAIALNQKFSTLTADSACTAGESACVNGAFAQCVEGKFTSTQCAGGTQCFALPLVNSAGTSVTCTTEADKDARIVATGASA